MSGKRVFGLFFVLENDQLKMSPVDSQGIKETHQKLLDEVQQKKAGVKIPPEKKKELMKEFQKILDQL